MKLFILFLFLVTVLAKRTYLPNMYIGCTIDMTVGEPGVGLYDSQTALRLFIIELTRSGRNMVNINGVLEIVPDQVQVIADPGMQTTSTTQVYLSIYDAQKSLTQAYSMKAKGFTPWMFGASVTVTDFKENYSEYGKFMAETSLIVTTYKGEILPETQNFTSSWTSIVKNLPTEYNNVTCPKFKYFLNEFGTHVITSVLSGGSVYMQTTFSESLTIQKSIQTITTDISAQFYLLTSNVNLTQEQEQELEQLNAVYTSTTFLRGGDPSKFYVNQSQEWQATVPNSPILLEYSILPLYKLVPKAQQKALEMATTAYFGSTIDHGWKTAAPYDFATWGQSCCGYNEYVYCVGGEMYYDETNIVLMYDPNTNMWINKASMQYKKSNTGLLCIPSLGKIMSIAGTSFLGGFAETYINNVELYDVVSNTWTELADVPIYEDNTKMFSGADNQGISQNFAYHDGYVLWYRNVYDPATNFLHALTYSFKTNEWTPCYLYWNVSQGLTPIPADGNLFHDDNILHIKNDYNQIYKFISLNTTCGIIELVTFGSSDGGLIGSSTQIGNSLYYFGGKVPYVGTLSSEVWEYKIKMNEWFLITSLPLATDGFGIAVVGTSVHIVGGIADHDSTTTHYIYTLEPALQYC